VAGDSRGGKQDFIYTYLDQSSVDGDGRNCSRDYDDKEHGQGSTNGGSPKGTVQPKECPFPYPLWCEHRSKEGRGQGQQVAATGAAVREEKAWRDEDKWQRQ
jgi:hypothetical protein